MQTGNPGQNALAPLLHSTLSTFRKRLKISLLLARMSVLDGICFLNSSVRHLPSNSFHVPDCQCHCSSIGGYRVPPPDGRTKFEQLKQRAQPCAHCLNKRTVPHHTAHLSLCECVKIKITPRLSLSGSSGEDRAQSHC